MTDNQVKTLYKLLLYFTQLPSPDDPGATYLNLAQSLIIRAVMQWVKWYAHDYRSIEIK